MRIAETKEAKRLVKKLADRRVVYQNGVIDLCTPCYRWFFRGTETIDHAPYQNGDQCAVCAQPLTGDD